MHSNGIGMVFRVGVGEIYLGISLNGRSNGKRDWLNVRRYAFHQCDATIRVRFICEYSNNSTNATVFVCVSRYRSKWPAGADGRDPS